MAFCTNCGTELVDDAMFCYKCGAKAISNVVSPLKIQTPKIQTIKNITQAGTKTLIDLTCDKCGANLRVTSDREFLFCEFCGKKVWVTENNVVTIHRIEDIAGIKRAEIEKEIRIKELETKKQKDDNKTMVASLFYGLLTLIVMLVLGVFIQIFAMF